MSPTVKTLGGVLAVGVVIAGIAMKDRGQATASPTRSTHTASSPTRAVYVDSDHFCEVLMRQPKSGWADCEAHGKSVKLTSVAYVEPGMEPIAQAMLNGRDSICEEMREIDPSWTVTVADRTGRVFGLCEQ
jgi:hypothetical protein